jgi:transposase-like protein
MKGRTGVIKPAVRYSEAFKLQVLRELEEGRWGSRFAAARAYGIRGQGMIAYWAQKYGKEHLMGKVIRVEQAKELNESRELRKRVRELEKALADAHLEHRFDQAYLRLACRAAGIEDVEEFKKKHAGKR